jgi:hypothetical protein
MSVTRSSSLLTLVAMLTNGLAVAGPAFAQPSTLTGVALVSNAAGQAGETTISSASCNPTGASTWSFASSGGSIETTVTGAPPNPYEGTFTETGSVTIGAQTIIPDPLVWSDLFRVSPDLLGPFGQLLGFTATFTIVSGSTTITGTKQLPAPSGSGVGQCSANPFRVGFATRSIVGGATYEGTYSATIVTPEGIYRDEGTTGVAQTCTLDTATLACLSGGYSFNEFFSSTLAAPTLVLDPPGNSPPTQGGRGCGDTNHEHPGETDCPH